MQIFKDNSGRSWTLAVNVDSIRRVKALAEVNLLDVIEGKLIDRIQADPCLLCDVLYALVKPDADKLSITAETFGQALSGDAIDHATQALLEEIVCFFPQRRRQIMTKALSKMQEIETKAAAMTMRKLDAISIDHLLSGANSTSGSAPV